MAFEITDNTLSASKETDLEPNIVVEFDGVATLYGAVPILEMVKIGSPGLLIGEFIIGQLIPIENQESYVSFKGGTSNSIKQTLKQEKGAGSGVSSLAIALVDVNKEISNLISPGKVVTDILGRRSKVWFGFGKTCWPDDYITIHRGIVESVDAKAGTILFNILHPEQKKRQTIFIQAETELNGAIDDTTTTVTVDDTTDFILPIVGPDTVNTDPNFKTFIRIDDEAMEVDETTVTATTFTVVRGALGTTADTHDDGASTSSVYNLTGTNIDIALKIMLSGHTGFSFENVQPTNFVRISASQTIANSIFFSGVNVVREYNLQVGDYFETTGALNGANNVSPSPLIKINGIIVTDNGSYITSSGVTFVEENNTTALISFKSQFDVWPSGASLEMLGDEVDISNHLGIKNRFLPSFPMDFRLQDEINAKDFITEQLFNPSSCFTLPRNSQASLGIHSPPLPDENIKVLDDSNVTNPKDLKISRSLNKNRTTTIIYKFDEFFLEPDEFEKGSVTLNSTAIDQTGGTQRTLTIESKGMRDILSGDLLASTAASRRLRKYAFGSEYISGLKLHFRDGFNLEVGDKVMIDMASLQLTDIQTGTRAGDSRVFEVDNILKNLRNGQTVVSVVDSNFNKDTRFCLVSPASKIKSATSDSVFVIEESFGSQFGQNEFLKWTKFQNPVVTIRSLDFAFSATRAISSIVGNEITLVSGLGFTPTSGYVMEYANYSDQTVENVKIIYGSLSDGIIDFADGGKPYALF